MMFLAVLGGAVGIPLIIAVSYLWRGYVLSVMWGWFMVPILHLPPLAIAPAIGITLVVSFMTYQYTDSKKSERSFGEQMAYATGYAVLSPALYLGTGWVVHEFMR